MLANYGVPMICVANAAIKTISIPITRNKRQNLVAEKSKWWGTAVKEVVENRGVRSK